MRGNQETKATIVVEVLSNWVGAYIARKPTQDLRDERGKDFYIKVNCTRFSPRSY